MLSLASSKPGHDISTPVKKKAKNAVSTDPGGHTTTPSTSDLAKLQQHKEDIKTMLAFVTSKKKIYRLVRKFVAGVVPKELWGSGDTKKNWKCVNAMLRKLIFSRKFDIFSLKKCAEEFQVTSVEWMNISSNAKFCPPNERVKRHQLFEDLLRWVISSLVFPLLRNLFYITEAEGMANEIAYYQRPVWNVISTLALDDLQGGILTPSSDENLPLSHERQLATSRLRLLPKCSGIRPLMNLSMAVDQNKVSVNRSMEAVHRVLTFEMERQPKRFLGSSVRNIDEIYKRLKPLFREISACSCCAERRRTSGEIPMAYCVSVDVERCFDTIRPRKLYQVLKKAIQEDEYLIRKHWVGHQVAPLSSSADSDESLSASSFFFKLERPAYPSGELLGFDELAAQSKKENAMFVDGVLYDYLTKTKALQLLKEHLSANVVQVDGRDYVQQNGIPQGSVLSTTLCNMYYAHFERRVLRKRLPEVCDPAIVPVSCCQHEELFRYTDDFMYITTDLKRARRFFDVMHEGNEEYGCFVNVAKSQANFSAADGGYQALRPDSKYISWCGMLIDATNLQLYVNYENLSSSLLQASIPFNETKAAQTFFVSKVVFAIRQRWHAMLPFVNQDMHFFHECINRISKKMTKGIHRSLGATKSASAASSGSYQAQKYQVWTIGLHAFQLTIQAKRDQTKTAHRRQRVNWQTLLDAVQAEQMKTQGTGRRNSCDLAWLIQDRRNVSVLKQCLHLDTEDRTTRHVLTKVEHDPLRQQVRGTTQTNCIDKPIISSASQRNHIQE